MLIEIIGYCAGALTTISFLPQVIKAWKTHSTKDISLSMFLMFTIGVSLWLVYGIMIYDIPIIIANTVTVLLAAATLSMKFKFG